MIRSVINMAETVANALHDLSEKLWYMKFKWQNLVYKIWFRINKFVVRHIEILKAFKIITIVTQIK